MGTGLWKEVMIAGALAHEIGFTRSILARQGQAADLVVEWDPGRETEDAGHRVRGEVSLVAEAEERVPLAAGGVARVVPGFLAPTYQGLH
jgi:hypothetical protein